LIISLGSNAHRRKRAFSPQPSAEPRPENLITLDEKSAPHGSDLFAGDWQRLSGFAWITVKPEGYPVVPQKSDFRQVRLKFPITPLQRMGRGIRSLISKARRGHPQVGNFDREELLDL